MTGDEMLKLYLAWVAIYLIYNHFRSRIRLLSRRVSRFVRARSVSRQINKKP